jgi:hypothetical protein
MTHCAKCGAELIGARKFCTACGTPAVDPATLKRDAANASPSPGPVRNAPGSSPQSSYGPPEVNPFAATASPASRAISPAALAPQPSANPSSASSPSSPSNYGPPPVPPQEMTPVPQAKGPSSPPPSNPAPGVSPLAVSNALSQRGAFDQVAGQAISQAQQGGAPKADAPPPPAQQKRIPGTQLMPSMQNPPTGGPASVAASASPPAPVAQRQKGTQVMGMGAFPVSQKPGASTPAASAASAASAAPAPSPTFNPPAPQAQPPSVAQPSMGAPHLASQPQPPHSQAAYPYSQQQVPQPPQPPMQQPGPVTPGWGWNPSAVPQQPQHAPPQQQQPYQYGFGYSPGSRVNVTWSNGHRYPATVQQVSGTQCLVMFPDGQQHWVEMQYVAPG